jgi:proline dehydrogenase
VVSGSWFDCSFAFHNGSTIGDFRVSVLRTALLAASTNAWLRDHATQYDFVKRSVRRFMPGETIDDALRAARALKPQGITAILTKLGENLTVVEEAEEVTRHYLDVLDRAAASGLDAHVSIKPTQLGLDFDRGLCERNLDRLIAGAEERNNIIWIDMESSPYVDPTLELFRRARARSARVGVALQAYLHRTAADLESLLPLGCAIRMVKGAYLEKPSIAYANKADVDENYYKLCLRLLDPAAPAGTLVHIATHDVALTDRLIAEIERRKLPDTRYEFAMLYGIQRAQQIRLASLGRRVRVLISYGEHWFPWYMRRLAERPANVWFVLKNIAE